jgi:AcrR family transcriptional regulator
MTKPKVKQTGADVKRSYVSPVRDEQGLATRRRIREAAEGLFLANGYVATSMTQIATAAGVSRPTVFNAFGSKVGLLKEVADVRLAGDDAPVELLARPLGQQMLTATDADELLRIQAELGAEVMERVAPILTVITDASAVDPDARALLRAQEDGRLLGMGAAVDRLVELDRLRNGLAPQQAKESLWLLGGLEPWALAQHRGWTRQQYEEWFHTCARALLVEP